MNLLTSTWLDRFRPSCWTVDLTRPEEWDEEQSMQETFIFNLRAAYLDLARCMHGPTKTLVTQGTRFHQAMMELGRSQGAMRPFFHELEKWEEQKNGTEQVVSHNPKVKLPKRKTNSGPKWDPHARGGRGGRV